MRRALALGVLLVAAYLRLRALDALPAPFWDEWLHAPTAVNYASRGLIDPDDWWHPPLQHLVRAAGIALLGDGPLGYRMPSVVFGLAAVALVVLLARRLTDDPLAPWVAGALLAADPLHVVLSRSSAEEVVVGTLMLGAVVLALEALDRPFPWAVPLGLALGLTMATKWYYAGAAAVVAGAVAVASWRRGERGAARVAYLLACLGALPVATYLASYLPWFAAGHSLREWWQLQLDMSRMVRAVRADMGSAVFAPSRSALDWFTRPVAMGVRPEGPGAPAVLFLTAFPLTLLVLPAVAWAGWSGVRRGSAPRLVVAGVFAVTWLPLLLVRRPIYVYSATSLLPYAWTLVAVGAGEAVARSRRSPRWLAALAVAALVAGLALFPVLAGTGDPGVLRPLVRAVPTSPGF